MALIKCEECGKEYSSTVLVCPNCGHTRTEGTKETQLAKEIFAERHNQNLLLNKITTYVIILAVVCICLSTLTSFLFVLGIISRV